MEVTKIRIIDADALKENAFGVYTQEYGNIDVVGCDAIDDAPTIGKIGRWEPAMKNGNEYGGYKCSSCGKKVSIRGSYTYNFCPYCGVKVRSTALFSSEVVHHKD